MPVGVLLLCFLVTVQCQNEIIYGLRVSSTGALEDVVATPPARGYMTLIVDLSSDALFRDVHPSTAYDPNLNTFIFGNVDPPTLGLVDTFAKEFESLEMPAYGSLVSFTAYDGILYCLQGLDEDVPFIGHMVSLNLETNKFTHLFKFKLLPGTEFVVGAPFVFVPEEQAWLITLGGQVHQITKNGDKATGVFGNFTDMWRTSDGEIVGYEKGKFSSLNLAQKVSKLITHLPCASGVPALNPQSKKVYEIQNCTGELDVTTGDLSNSTQTNLALDPRLGDIKSAQVGGHYVPFKCGATCNTHPDCGNSTSCNTCRLGRCVSSGECGAFCVDGQDCFGGVCVGNCEEGRCGKAGCGADCQNHDECKRQSSSCQICRLGKCVADGECGSYCLTALDCYGGACINNCVNWRCTQSA
eukprot:TRINITY_DN4949_c0_g2_i1.p1 TRINITY_DN4949_c0_g2~~TRINITY_DN4949_c0_g2_i1.p1  ORF type:complete len:412 (+),score=62.74 TRINITY_DN4949_c0_g2_i1:7-1242(+)